MTRAYLRLDPGFDARKEHYPDGAYAALVAVLCLAESQPERGRFRNARFLRALLGRRGRWVPYLVKQGDITELEDGRLYVEGWDEWQEGDWKVAERLHRVRQRRERHGLRRNGSGPRATVPDVSDDTPVAVSGATSGATDARHLSRSLTGSRAVSGAVGGAVRGDVARANGDLFGDQPPDDPLLVVRGWLSKRRADIDPGGRAGTELARLVDRHGSEAVIAAMAALGPGLTDGRQYVYGASKALAPIPDVRRAPPARGYQRSEAEVAAAFARDAEELDRAITR